MSSIEKDVEDVRREIMYILANIMTTGSSQQKKKLLEYPSIIESIMGSLTSDDERLILITLQMIEEACKFGEIVLES